MQNKTMKEQRVKKQRKTKINIFNSKKEFGKGSWSVPKIDPHFVTLIVDVKESLIMFFLSIIKLIEQASK